MTQFTIETNQRAMLTNRKPDEMRKREQQPEEDREAGPAAVVRDLERDRMRRRRLRRALGQVAVGGSDR